jgi:hypothetical protein
LKMHHLWSGAIISIESRGDRKQVWMHLNNQRVPLVNSADLQEGMEEAVVKWDGIYSFLRKEGQASHNN